VRIPFALACALALAVPGCTVRDARDARGVARIADLDDAPPSTLRELDVGRFSGRWYVVRSNFPFWTKKDRTDPSFLYLPIVDPQAQPGLVKLDDRVEFRQRGRARRYVGVDLQDPTRAGHFQWRGDGALYGLVNHWYVVHVAPDFDWAIVYFSESNFGSDAGLEVIARVPELQPEAEREAMAIIAADPFLAARSAGMYTPRHTPRGPTDARSASAVQSQCSTPARPLL
jgi:hypothetical protein